MAASPGELTMHGYFRSSCTGRLRIAMYIKNIDFKYVPVHLLNESHFAPDYVKINPSRSVPALVVAGQSSQTIAQSFAALEYLEEAYPDAISLLPKDALARAQVRSLVNIVVADIQPVTNLRVSKKVTPLGYDGPQWSREFHALGFEAFEAIVKSTAGTYCFGDAITLADVCLAPAVWNAERWGLDMTPFPTLTRVYENAKKNEAFERGHWRNAEDCPDNLK